VYVVDVAAGKLVSSAAMLPEKLANLALFPQGLPEPQRSLV